MQKSKLQQDLKAAMLARDKEKTSVLRMLLSAINYYETGKGGAGYGASEDDVLSVMEKEVKQRKDSIEQFKAGGRQDLVDKETRELELLQAYLPEQMSEEKIKAIVEQTIKEVGATSMQDIGKLMGALMPKVKGKAGGGLVSKIVKEELSLSQK